MSLPELSGDHSKDLEMLREHLRDYDPWNRGGDRKLAAVLDAAIAILADFQRSLAAIEFQAFNHNHNDGGAL